MVNQCITCNSEASLKCDKCSAHCCSSTCLEKHMSDSCSILLSNIEQNSQVESRPIQSQNIQTGTQRANEDLDNFIPLDVMSQKHNSLRDSEEVMNLLNNPHLRNLLLTIDKADNADVIMQKAMLEPIFVEFADACLKVIDPDTDHDHAPT